MQTDPLNSLHDIALPAAVSPWPPALGWWLVLLGGILILGLSIFFVLRSYRRQQKRRIYLQALAQLEPEHSTAYYAAVNRLLKQAVLAYRGPAAKTLSGQAWLNYLDKQVSQALFIPACGNFATAVDNPHVKLDANMLHSTCEQWLRAIK